jgi:hypothetical protein
MARKQSFVVAAINLTMHPHQPSRYVKLIQSLARVRAAAQIRGEYQATLGTAKAIDDGDPESGLAGVIYKFFELDKDANWFNVVRQKAAEPGERARVQIPAELKPHYSPFNYVFFPRSHLLFFETKWGPNNLSPGNVHKMLIHQLARPQILQDFGHVDVTVEPSRESLERIFKMPSMSRFQIELTRPNADDLANSERTVMQRLASMNAQREGIELVSEKGKPLKPDEALKIIARVAQSNGHVEAEGRGADDKRIFESTEDHPLKETVTYDPKVEGRLETLISKATEMVQRIRKKVTGKKHD